MELEQRIKTLEYEMKIVKNEIQRTLLDIQEQVLIHYYPTLRLDDVDTPNGAVEALGAIRARQASADTAASLPTAKKVSLVEARTVANHPAPPEAPSPANIVKLVDWATGSSARIGGERVGKLVEAYSKKSLLPPEVRGILMQVATLYKTNPAAIATNDVIGEASKLDAALGRATTPEQTIALLEEAGLG